MNIVCISSIPPTSHALYVIFRSPVPIVTIFVSIVRSGNPPFSVSFGLIFHGLPQLNAPI